MAPPTRSRYLVIFLVSLVTIAFQLLATRVLAFVFWNHVVYLVVSIALLGYGVSSTLVAIFHRRIEKVPEHLFLSVNLLSFALSALLALSALAFLRVDLLDLGDASVLGVAVSTLPLLAAYALFLLPFFFAGNVVVYLFYRDPGAADRLYAFDLIGAALGCLLFVDLIRRVGATGGILLCALSALVCALLLLLPRRRHRTARMLLAVTAASAIVVAALVPVADRLFRFSSDSAKVLSVALDRDKNPASSIEYSAWDVVSRLDVVAGGGEPLDLGWTEIAAGDRLVTFDGDAISHVPRRSPDFPTDEELSAFESSHLYALLESAVGGDHLVIGLGGGPDLGTSLLLRARSITGVDIHGALIRALRSRFADIGGQVFNRPEVRIVHSEGRSFLRREDRRYDLIFMSGVDTFTALNLGAYVLAENYLYTVEAIDDYTAHLTDDGVLFILRWFFPVQPRESLKLFATALESLRRQGVEDPGRHVVVLKYLGGFSPGITLVKKSPYSTSECGRMLDRIATRHQDFRFVYLPEGCGSWGHAAGDESRFFVALERAYREGSEESFFDRYPYDVAPVDDNRPFFFKYYKLGQLWRQTRRSLTNTGPIHGYWSYLVLVILLAASLLAVSLFIWMPLTRFERQGLSHQGSLWAALYFASLGLGFIMLEIALMQKLALFLGHPMYSIAAVLGGLLAFAGAGSRVSGRWRETPLYGVVAGFAGMAVTTLAFVVLADVAIDRLLHLELGWRIAAAVAAIAPLAFALGFFFPLGLRLVERRSPRFVPWAWGINAGFTVIGSVLAILIAMALGFDEVMLLTVAIYGGGTLAIHRYERRDLSAEKEP